MGSSSVCLSLRRVGSARALNTSSIAATIAGTGRYQWLRLWQPRHLGKVRVHVIPWLGTRGVDVPARPELTRVVQTTGSNSHDVYPGAWFAKKRRPALGAEKPPSRMTTVRLDVEVLRPALRQCERCSGHGENWGKGTPSLSLTIPTVTVQRKEWGRRTLIANRTTGTATSERGRHRILLCGSFPYHRLLAPPSGPALGGGRSRSALRPVGQRFGHTSPKRSPLDRRRPHRAIS